MSYTAVSLTISVATFLFVILVNKWGHRIAHHSGYWSGRNDETAIRIMLEVLNSRGVPEEELVHEFHQIVSQQCDALGVPLPHQGWPRWDGIDRIALYLPEETLELVYPSDRRPPWFMRRRKRA